MNSYYKFKFYLNAKHSVTIKEKKSTIHPHTWEIVVSVKLIDDEYINFTEFENKLQQYFDKFEGKYLNELDEYELKEPTMENICKVSFENINKLLIGSNLTLKRIEVSENPTRTYIIESK